MKRYIDWEDVIMRVLMTLLVYLGVTAITALLAGVVQARGGSLLVQCIVGFGPGLIPAAVCWRQLR
jgi:hypothetical protein